MLYFLCPAINVWFFMLHAGKRFHITDRSPGGHSLNIGHGFAFIVFEYFKILFMKTKEARRNTDLPESDNDKKHLQPDEANLDLPEVKDIPGQEHIRPFLPREMADTTISSADEEGKGVLDIDEDIIADKTSNVSNVEKDLLEQSIESMSATDDVQLTSAELDSTDDDGDVLNEGTGHSGNDLDVPGSEEDDANEEIGEEDEENNSYSLPDQEDE